MTLGSSLFQARKKQGLSQEDVAEKLGVSRQTVSKWETDETVPDLRQAKRWPLSIISVLTNSSSSIWTKKKSSRRSNAPAIH
ncbi:helix-turn-helix transcriptional regulator [Allobaculum sp. Allo2]|uniref:helix-turn-helix transcriptional regulator n=1 Tax=Allobaculum sp. Allo2 TaxID=2853432 RepID=UPI001F61A833|nr:helix-turn-helix transcriptional regulator [Allobaculum sp. Allo2]